MGAVRFLKPWSLYNPGETAGFDAETTAMLIANGTAVDATEAEAEPEAELAPEPEGPVEAEAEATTEKPARKR